MKIIVDFFYLLTLDSDLVLFIGEVVYRRIRDEVLKDECSVMMSLKANCPSKRLIR